MLVLLAGKDSHHRAKTLCSPKGAAVLRPLLAWTASLMRSSQPSSAAGVLGLIVHHSIWQQGLLQDAMVSLASPDDAKSGRCAMSMASILCSEQVVLLQLLADELEDPAISR